MAEEKSLGNYSMIVKHGKGRFTVHIPELSVVADDESLEGAYRKLLDKKEKSLAEFAASDVAPPPPQNLPTMCFAWRFVVVATVIALTCAAVTTTNILVTRVRDFSGNKILDSIKSSKEESVKDITNSLKLAMDDLPLNIKNMKNLSLHKPTKQSSFQPGYPNSEGGVDGIKNGEFGFHTDAEETPWWQVDLGATSAVEEIRVYNRMCCKEPAKSLQILLSDNAENWRTVYTHDGTVFGGIDGNYLKVRFDRENARFVRLQVKGLSHFFLDEVEVYGLPPK